jgi:serine/threonine-protein kinase
VIRSDLVFVVGSLVAGGKYRVDRIIGRGGMGMVIGATHLRLQQPVALKFLLPELAEKPEVVERFVREARASAQLRGEHVCRVSDVETAENGAPYIVMELLEGRDLASLVDARGALPVPLVADYVLQACAGIAEAHALGIVHRDLKPGNLFLTARPDGTPLIKVLDFGIAKAQREQAASLTHTSTVLGSPSYMSPEQLKSPRNADVRSDIWSVGVILYELTSGQLPFTGETLTALALRISMDPVPPLGGQLPPGFDAVVYRCLEKEPAQRYPDLAELAHALAPYAGLVGRELAGAVGRLLHRADRAAWPVSVATQVSVTGAVAERERASVAATQPEVTADPAPRGSPPTTMGSAASSMATAESAARHRGVIAGVAGAAILAAVVTIAVVGGTKPTGTGGVRDPVTDAGAGAGSSAATPSAPDAADVVATQRPIDAGPVPLPVDAGMAQASIDAAIDAGAAASTTVHPPSEGPKKTPPKKDRPRPRTPGEEEDFGATRH